MTVSEIRLIYTLLLFLASINAVSIAVVAWRRKRAPGATPLAVMAFGQAFWALCYGLHLSSAMRPIPIFWENLTFIGVTIVPAAFFCFSLEYTGRRRMVTWWLLLFLLCEPLFVNVAVWTDPWHGLFSGVKPPQMVTTYVGGLGIIFWLHTVYSYGLLMVSGLLLYLYWLSSPPAYKKQALLIIIGLFVALSFNALTIFQLTPWHGIDFPHWGAFFPPPSSPMPSSGWVSLT